MSCPGEGVELGVSGVRHPGGGAGVVTPCPGTWNHAGGDGPAGCSWSTGDGARLPAGRVGRAELPLVVDGPGLGSYFIVGGGVNVVVAVGWILRSEETAFQSHRLFYIG